MKILLFGHDSATHALAWKLVNSPYVGELILAPGNAGTAFLAPSTDLDPLDAGGLTTFLLNEQVDLVIADGQAIAAGVADEIGDLPVPVVGSRRALYRLHQSRCAMREWLQQHALPLPRGRGCTSAAQAERVAATLNLPLLIIADALDGPTLICHQRTDVPQAIATCLEGNSNGVIVQELVRGPVVVAPLLTDGQHMIALPATRVYPIEDHPYAPFDGGHSAATPLWTRLQTFLNAQVRDPLLGAIRETDGVCGWIEAACVIGPRGPLVLGVQLAPSGFAAASALLRMDGDLLPLLIGAGRGTLRAAEPPRWKDHATVAVALRRHDADALGSGFTADAFEAFEPGVLVFHHNTIPALPNIYQPQANRYPAGRSSGRGIGAIGVGGGSFSRSADPTAVIVVTTGSDLSSARDRVYTSLQGAALPRVTYRNGVGQHEL
jgi:phosphoribosylamine---glycine ligase